VPHGPIAADDQAITDRDAPESLPGDVLAQVADYLASGIDPGRSTIFAHSQIEALNQLFLPFLSLVSVARTEPARLPALPLTRSASSCATVTEPAGTRSSLSAPVLGCRYTFPSFESLRDPVCGTACFCGQFR
jgi:hypothetical protein